MEFPLTSNTLRPQHCDPLFLLRELGLRDPYCALLESADRHGDNDFSFLALGVRDQFTVQNGQMHGSRFAPDGTVSDPLAPFQTILASSSGGERLRMGYIGFLSYESARTFESIALTPARGVPDAFFFLPEVLIRIDHNKHEVTLIAHADTHEDIRAIERVIASSPFRDDRKERTETGSIPLPTLEEIHPLRQTSREQYTTAVRDAQKDIVAGEAFQVVLSQELRLQNNVPADRVYEELRRINPSPYMYYVQTPKRTLVGASPETLVRVTGRHILYRPIAGTRKRTGNPANDAIMREELLCSEKERCEHQMLVDLGRNDVGRVAEIGSVAVQDPFHVEQYAHVYHLVSDVTGTLRSGLTSLDALRSVFPAGTLTGAPKVRAMEIIRRLEPSPRGVYGGAFGYIDLSGDLDFAITIRTLVFDDAYISLRVGAGIVKDSIPEREDDECLHKARSCLAAVTLARNCSPIP